MIGSGRSELLRTIFGADRATGARSGLGPMLIPASKARARQLAQGLALLPESRKDEGLLLSQTVGDNIVLPICGIMSHLPAFLSRHRQQNLVNDSIGTFGIRCAGGGANMNSLSGGHHDNGPPIWRRIESSSRSNAGPDIDTLGGEGGLIELRATFGSPEDMGDNLLLVSGRTRNSCWRRLRHNEYQMFRCYR